MYINCACSLPLTSGSKLTMYADDILLFKPIYCPEDYRYLQQDIDAINGCTRACHLKLNPSKCKYIIASKKRHPLYPSSGLFLGSCIMEQVDSYRYLGVTVTSTLNWNDHIQHICSKARKLIGMLHRRFSSWADTNTLRCLYLTCIRPHLEYASQLWGPYTNKGIQSLESVQKFACKVCLQQWNLAIDYDSMLQLLNFPPLSTRRNFLKLTTMYKIIGNFSYFPPGVFVQHNFPYSTNQHTNFSRPFARTQYMFSSFVPSVITLWNALPNSVKHASSISVFKRLLHSM